MNITARLCLLLAGTVPKRLATLLNVKQMRRKDSLQMILISLLIGVLYYGLCSTSLVKRPKLYTVLYGKSTNIRLGFGVLVFYLPVHFPHITGSDIHN